MFVLKCFSQASRIAPVTSPIVCVIPPSKSLTLSANTSSECKATSSATYFAIIAPNSHSYASTDRSILATVSLNAIHATEPSRLINSAVICATFDFNGYGSRAPFRAVNCSSFEMMFMNSFFNANAASSSPRAGVVSAADKSLCKIEYPKCLFSIDSFSSSPPRSMSFFAIATDERTSSSVHPSRVVIFVKSSSARDNARMRASSSSAAAVVFFSPPPPSSPTTRRRRRNCRDSSAYAISGSRDTKEDVVVVVVKVASGFGDDIISTNKSDESKNARAFFFFFFFFLLLFLLSTTPKKKKQMLLLSSTTTAKVARRVSQKSGGAQVKGRRRAVMSSLLVFGRSISFFLFLTFFFDVLFRVSLYHL